MRPDAGHAQFPPPEFPATAFQFVSAARRIAFAAALLFGLAFLPRSAAAQSCTTIVPPCPANEPPRIVISPNANPDVHSSTVDITVTVTDDHPMGGNPSYSMTLTNVTQAWTGNNTSGSVSGTLTLSGGSNVFTVIMTDDDGVADTATVTFVYDAPAGAVPQAAPTLFTDPHSSTVRSVAGCSGCLYGGASYTTPAYVSRDVPRGVTLVYSSAQAVPRGLVQLDALICVPSRDRSSGGGDDQHRYDVLLPAR